MEQRNTNPEIQIFFELFDKILDEIADDVETNAFADNLANAALKTKQISQNMADLNINQPVLVIDTLCDIIDLVYNSVLDYSIELGEVIKLTLMEMRMVAEKDVNGISASDEINCIINILRQIAEPTTHNSAIQVAIDLLDPFVIKPKDKSKAKDSSDANSYKYVEQDLEFFSELSQIISKRISLPDNYIKLAILIASEMNRISGYKVNNDQLTAAIYLDHFAMIMYPLDFHHKYMLTDKEEEQIKQIPIINHNFLQHLPHWAEAKQMLLQCHEHINGRGFPNKLKDADICDGAKILSISQAFVRMLYNKPVDDKHIMWCIMEISNCADTQFSNYWVDIFVPTVKHLHEQKKLN